MKKLLVLWLISATVVLSYGQSGEFKRAMKAAHKTYADAVDAEGLKDGLQAFQEVIQEHDKEWQPYFWAAYVSASLGQNDKENSRNHLEKALSYYEKAKTIAYDQYPSEFLTLKGFVLSQIRNMHNRNGNEEDLEKYKKLTSEAFRNAAVINNVNPMLYIFQAMSIASEGMREKKPGKALAGKGLFLKARDDMQQYVAEIYLTPYFNYDIIDAFLPMVDDYLAREKGDLGDN